MRKGEATIESQNKSEIQSIHKAFQVIEILADSESGLGVAELSSRLGWHKSTTHRFLSTLAKEGYVRQIQGADKYVLSFKWLAIANKVVNKIEIRAVARDFLKTLADQAGTDVHLAVFDNDEVVFIDRIDSQAPLKTNFHIGRRAPAHCTAVGKFFLAHLPEEEVERIAREKGLKGFTPRTITSLEKLKEHLAEIRYQGFAVDYSEHNEGIACIAAGIWNHDGRLVATVSASGATHHILGERIAILAPLVTETAERISQSLGYIPEVSRAKGGQ